MANDQKPQQHQPTPSPSPHARGAQPTVEEDWLQDNEPLKVKAPEGLAGMYKVTHGTLFFSEKKQVRAGRHVILTAEEAFHLLGHALPEEDPSDPRPRFEPLIQRVA